MKRASILGALAIVAGFFFAASAAQAQVTMNPIQRNGITCQQHLGGTYPENGRFFSCSTVVGNQDYNAQVLAAARSVLNAWPQVRTRFTNAPVEFYVFNNPDEYFVFVSTTNPTLAQRQANYNGFRGISAVSPPPPAVQRAVVVFKDSAPTGATWSNPPTFTTHPSLPDVTHTTRHEMGHNWDFLMAVGGVFPSSSTEFDRIALIDDAWIKSRATNPSGTQRVQTYSYWLVKDTAIIPPATTAKNWAELHAEAFANSFNTYLPVDSQAIDPFYVCTKQYINFMKANGRAPVQGTSDYTGRCR